MADRAELEALRRQKRLRELEARIAKPVAEETPQQQKSAVQRFSQGMADRGVINANKLVNLQHTLGNKMLNLVGVDMPLPAESPFSAESIRAQEQMADQSTAGNIGSLAMETVQTAPLGMIGRGMAAGKNLPVVGRALGSRPLQAAVEGGAAGAMVGDPGARGEDILRGAAFGTALERGGRLLGRTLEGLVRRSPQAKSLDVLADLHGTKVNLPLAQAASEEGIISPFAKFLYGKVLPALPGTSGTLGRQSQRAAAQLREIALKEAAPGGMGSTSAGYAAGLPMTTAKKAGAGTDVRLSMKQIQDAFDREYSTTIKSYSFNQPQTQDFVSRLQQTFPNIDDGTLNSVAQTFDSLASRYSKNGVLDGDNLVRMKSQLARLGREAGDDRLGQSYFQAQEFLDDVVKAELTQGGKFQNMVDLQRYLDLAEPWRNFQRVQRAAARSKDPDGLFTPQELMSSVKNMSRDRDLARGTAPMQELAAIGEKTVGTPTHQPSFLEKGMTYSALAGLGVIGSPAAAVGLAGAGRMAASPAIQDVLMGTTNTQQALLKALRKRPEAARLTGANVRNVMAAEVADDEQEQ